VEIDTATANTHIDGTITVVGKSTLNQLDVEQALATGSSSGIVTIDKATGILTSASSKLAPYAPNGGGSLATSGVNPQIETLILMNNRVSSTSVVIATVVEQCNANSMVTVRSTVCANGQVTFTVVNLGAQACVQSSFEAFKLAFVVLN
jgi:hypothetical protein